MAKDLMTELESLHGDVKSFTGRTQKDLRDLQKQVDFIDSRTSDRIVAQGSSKGLETILTENEDVSRLIRDRKGRAYFTLKGDQIPELMEQKTTVLLSGQSIATPGVVTIERMPGIVLEARRRLTIRQLLTSRPTTAGLIYYVKVNSPISVASPQVEGLAKQENAVTFTVGQATVKTIATWIPASKQALDDVTELEGFLRASLPYYVNRLEETQLLSGDNTGENLNGLITQSTAFNTALLSATAGWTRIDQIGAAIEQIAMIDEVPPSFVALNPIDWWNMRRTKDTLGRYILGDPQSVGSPTIWDLIAVPTNSVVVGTFLVGGGDPAQCEIRDRMEMQVEISTEHADYFTRNLIAIRAEKRLALIVQRPQSFIHGTFTTSPA
jgi:HK97 family phage major capsid protein